MKKKCSTLKKILTTFGIIAFLAAVAYGIYYFFFAEDEEELDDDFFDEEEKGEKKEETAGPEDAAEAQPATV